MAVKDRHGRTLCIESPPVSTRKIDQVLKKNFVAYTLLSDPEELEMGRSRKGFRDRWFIWENPFEPHEIFAMPKFYARTLEGNEAINLPIRSEKPASVVHFHNGESTFAVVLQSCGFLH